MGADPTKVYTKPLKNEICQTFPKPLTNKLMYCVIFLIDLVFKRLWSYFLP